MALARLVPPALLVAYGVAFAAAAFGLDVPAFDDHPGQLYRLWHVVARGLAPWQWNPDWWAGYPELQFYPPGYFYFGAILHHVSFGLITVTGAYRILLWTTYLAPGLTSLLILTRLVGNAWLALPGAFVALTLSAGVLSGVEGGIHIGMLPARLGWSLLPVLALTLAGWARGAGLNPVAAPLIASIVLVHPAHAPTAIVLLVLAALLGPAPRMRRIGAAVVVLATGAMLTGFWTFPLLARVEYARALAWGRLAPLDTLAATPLLAVLLLLAALAPWLARSPAEALVSRWPWAMMAVVLLQAAVVEATALRWLPADRIADGAWLGVVLAAGFTTARLLERVIGSRRATPALLGLGAVALTGVLSLPGAALALWPQPSQWPSLHAVEQGLRLNALWAALRQAPEGRVLFLRSAVPLVYGPDWWRSHTHVTALAPLYTGRGIVHGTFTHPSPVAALVYRGDPGRQPITALAEQRDGQALFGRPLDALDAPTLGAYTDRLGVSVVVGLDEDAPRLAALDALLVRRGPVGPFLVWQGHPIALPVSVGPGRWGVRLEGGPGEWVGARTSYYPLWRAERDGVALQTRRGSLWDLEVRLAPGAGAVMLVYAAGWAEITGVALSVAGLVAWSATLARRRLLRR
ncbi:MAG: hypothetical protein ACREJV_07155 [Candidatus Rokuibacteriota bacterium]